MDLAQVLVRSYARSFYSVEHILVLDAVIMHLALAADDLAYLLGSQPKYTRKLCNRLRDDGVLHLHVQQEIKAGAFRATGREYYYVNMHRAVDSIKWRLKSLEGAVAAKYGRTQEEKRDWSCPQCKSEYFMMEVLDSTDWAGRFTCRRCGEVLEERREDGDSSGSERQSRLNEQLKACLELLQRIDAVPIGENEWEYAYENRRAVERDAVLNPGVKSEVVPASRLGPGTVHGRAVEAERLHVELHDSAAAQEAEARKREADRRAAAQNQLPVWHTNSTVTGEQTELGRKEEEQRRERDLYEGAGDGGADDKAKVAVEEMEESEQMRAYKAAVRAAAEQEAAEEAEDDEDDDDDDVDEDEFEDVELGPAKRIKLDEGSATRAAAPPPKPTPAPDAGGKANINGNGVGKAKAAPEEEDDSDEDANFEDVL